MSSIFPEMGEIMGTYLAGLFCLNKEYFSVAFRKNTKLNAEIRMANGYVFVKLPKEVQQLIEDGYISCKIDAEDKAPYHYKYELSKNCIIGFWK